MINKYTRDQYPLCHLVPFECSESAIAIEGLGMTTGGDDVHKISSLTSDVIGSTLEHL